MTMPTLIVEIGFSAATTGTVLFLDDTERGILDTNTLAAGDLLVDVTQYVTSVTTRRGATRADGPTLRYEAGTCTIEFNNNDRRFDPANLSGPYVAGGRSQVEPLRVVRVRATWGDYTWPLWRGFTDQWSVAYDGPNKSTATVTCFDAFGVFSAHNRVAVAAVGAGETTDARVGRILDGIGWLSGDRMISTGEETVQATTLDGDALSELLLTADTELGELWMDAEGRVVFRARSAGYTDSRSAYPQAQFGDQVVDGVDTTINLVSNPSVETNLTGWAAGGGAGGPTIALDTTHALFGTSAILATWGGGGFFPQVNYDVTGLTVGRIYTISVYVWVPTGSPAIDTIVGGTSQFGTTSTLNDQWERLVWTGLATATTLSFQLWPQGSTVAGQQFWIDGLQAEEGTTATAYVDGDQTYCEWDGVAHASTSRRLPELPYSDVPLAYDALSITNTYNVARAGGTTQTTSDAGSVSAYLTRSHERSDLLMETDAEALMWAEQLLARTASPELRFAAVELQGSRDPDRLWPEVFGREIGDRVRLVKRPPGGGDPIEQEAWVRGVEHQLGADLDWRTRLILEKALSQTSVSDAFGRTVSSGWGSADSGQAWTTTGGSTTDYAVGSGTGQHTLTSTNVLRSSYVDLGMANQVLTVDVTVPVVPTGAAMTFWLAGRVTDSSNYYTARLSIATTGATTLGVYRMVSGALSSALATTTAATHTAGNTWRIELHTLGTTVRARTWRPASDFEPSYTSVTDSTLSTGTQVGVLSRRETGNTNTNPVIQFDTFSAAGRRWWD